MKHKLDIENWARKEHFLFFNQFEEPYYGVNVTIDCTNAYRTAKAKGISFFIYYLHKALEASQLIEPFRMRVEDDEVYVYDVINGGSTVGRDNGTFGFGHYKYYPSIEEFSAETRKEMDRVKLRSDLERSPGQDLIRFSALPWIDFTALSHARSFSFRDSAPKISFGKMTEKDGRRTMPMSIHVHHALVDGLHVGQYIDCFQQLMDKD